MLTCKKAATLLSQDLDGELSTLNRVVLQAHLAICSTCRKIQRQFRLMETALAKQEEFAIVNAPQKLSNEFRTQLQLSLNKAMENGEPD